MEKLSSTMTATNDRSLLDLLKRLFRQCFISKHRSLATRQVLALLGKRHADVISTMQKIIELKSFECEEIDLGNPLEFTRTVYNMMQKEHSKHCLPTNVERISLFSLFEGHESPSVYYLIFAQFVYYWRTRGEDAELNLTL